MLDDKTTFSSSLSVKGINFLVQLFQNSQQIKKRDELKTEFDLIKNKKFLIVQITHALLFSWEEILRNYTEQYFYPESSLDKKTSNFILE